jgi:hypothetical protein
MLLRRPGRGVTVDLEDSRVIDASVLGATSVGTRREERTPGPFGVLPTVGNPASKFVDPAGRHWHSALARRYLEAKGVQCRSMSA